jgi:hypothetical protein
VQTTNQTTTILIAFALGFAFALLLSRRPQIINEGYNGAKVDSLIYLNTLRADTVGYLRDTIALLNYKDSVVRYRYNEHLEASKRRIDSITYWTNEDVDRWLCENYGYCQ